MSVELEWKGGTAIVRLNRPGRLNALTLEMASTLVRTFNELSERRDCRAVVVTGEGRGFCAGMDVTAVSKAGLTSGTTAELLSSQESFAALTRAARRLQHPLLAAINGAAAGAGFALALAADVRIASTSAAFHVASIKLGLSAGECGISYFLPRAIGTSRAFEIMLTGRAVGAMEADHIGLVSATTKPEDLEATALAMATTIATNSPFAVEQTKRIMWRNLDLDFESAMELENRTQILAAGTADYEEAVAAFLEKRTPDFGGR